jgi:HD-GYP domain-containing protein (c-di-GMP phosphodiesterase class II)
MSREKVISILRNNVDAGHIDPDLTELAITYIDELRDIVDKHR